MTFVRDARSNTVDVRIGRGAASRCVSKSLGCAYPNARAGTTRPSLETRNTAPGMTVPTAALINESADATPRASAGSGSPREAAGAYPPQPEVPARNRVIAKAHRARVI